MAARFWVGGTGSWDAATTTHWSASTGGAGGASVPTSSDDVTFDSNSGASAIVSITTAANANSITINKSDLTLLHSAAGSTVVGAVTLTTGTLNTNGQTCSWGNFSSTNSSTRTLTLGASAISLTLSSGTAWDTGTSTNMTFTPGTSTITFTGPGSTGTIVTVNAGNLTYNSVVFAPSGTNQPLVLNGSNPTFANFTVTGGAGSNSNLSLGTGITVTTALTLNGNTASSRLLVNTVTIGTPQTITNNGTGTFSNLDFQDIVGAGSASWNLLGISGGSGDCQGNSGITFNAARTLYWVGNTSNWSAANKWSLASGGSANQSNPLAQDNIVFDANSFSGTGQTVTLNIPRAGKSIDFSAVTNNPTLAGSFGAGGTTRIYGSLTLAAGMTMSGTGNMQFEGRASNTLTPAGVSFTSGINLNAPGGTLTLTGGDLTISGTNSLNIKAGTFTATTNNLTVGGNFVSSANDSPNPVVAKTLNMGSGTWTTSGTGFVWNTASSASLTINAQTSTIVVSNTSATSKTFSGNAFTYNNVTFSGDNIAVLGNNTFSTMNVNNAGLSNGLQIGHGTTQTITNNFTTNGSAGNLAILASNLGGSAGILSKSSGTVSVDYMSIKDSTTAGGAAWYAGNHSANVSGNTGWIFEAPPNWTSGWGIPI